MNVIMGNGLIFYLLFSGILSTIKGLFNHVDREYENGPASVFIGMLFIIFVVVWWFT